MNSKLFLKIKVIVNYKIKKGDETSPLKFSRRIKLRTRNT